MPRVFDINSIVRNNITQKAQNNSAKQFSSIFTQEEIVHIYNFCSNISPAETKTKTLGKYVACFVLDIREDKKCIICNNNIPYRDHKTYFKQQYCCNKCREADRANININANKALKGNKESVIKRSRTLQQKYGSTNAMHVDAIKMKRTHRCILYHGVSSTNKLESVIDKRKQTNLEKYGVSNYLVKYQQDNSPKLQIKYNSLLHLTNIEPLFTCDEYYGILTDKKTNTYNFKCKRCNNVIQKHLGSWNNIDCCDICDDKINTYELFIENILKSKSINYIKHDRKILDGQELDFYLPDKKIAIEIDGLYYHSNKFIADKQYHFKKTQKCKEKGIQLIHIFGDEFFNKKSLETRLYSILGVNNIKIGARLCDVCIVQKELKNKFINKYHMQHDVKASSVDVGLFYKNRLLSIMSFGKNRKSLGSTTKDDEYELYRYCSMKNVSVVGGASKLFKYFVDKYNPSIVKSFGDLRYIHSINNVYNMLGMQFSGQTSPSYWIIQGNKRYHRFGFRKYVLKDKLKIYNDSMSEKQNLELNNINIIYDCGNLCYKYNKVTNTSY